MTRIEGSNAVVTGGASGIGRGIAEQLIARGARVAIADIDADRVTAVAREIGAHPIVVDVSSLESVRAMAEEAVRAMGSVEIVVNNAGIGPFAKIADLSMDDWHWIIDVNLYGVLHGLHVFLPLLEAQGRGHIVNTASMAALVPLQTLGSYAVTKMGVAAATEVLQAELADAGSPVRATLLLPGAVRTDIARSTRNRPQQSSGALRDAEIDLSFSGSARWLDPAEVGAITVRAIENDDDYAITHPDRLPQVEARFDRIRQAFTRYADD